LFAEYIENIGFDIVPFDDVKSKSVPTLSLSIIKEIFLPQHTFTFGIT